MPAFFVSPRSGHPRRGVTAGVVAASLAGLMALQVQSAAPVHAAEPVPATYQGQAYPTAGPAPTEDKPQSKLWFNDGAWWALMRVTAGVTVHRLGADHVWTDTGTVVDERLASTADVLWEGGKLYVGSRTGSGALRVIRLSYDDAADTYSVDFSQQVAGGGSESITLARDSRGRLWVTYEQGERIHVAHSTTDDRTWGAPFPVPVTTAGADNDVAPDDISAIVAFSGKIGVMWSDQDDDVMRFAVHADTADDQTWTMETALTGPNLADDHLNLKSLLEDDHGRIYAAIKTSRGDAGEPTTDPSIMVLQRTADGTWSSAQASSVGDKLTRPQLALDSTNRRLYVLMATESGGSVYYKTAPLGSLSFPVGKGNTFITYPGASINDASTAKHAVSATTGLVVLASDDDAKRYYHGELALGVTPPADSTAPGVPQGLTAIAATPTSVDLGWQASTDDVGVTGYMVSRDGAAATTVATTSFTDTGLTPGTTYSYTVSAIDAAGNRSSESAPVTATTPTVEEPPPSSDPVSFVAATSVNAATNTISVPTPAGVRAGDVLLATVSVRGAPTISPSPGWTLVRLDTNGTTMRQAVYLKVATGSDGSSTWTLNKAYGAVAQVLAYHGVDTTNPVVASAGQVTSTTTLTSPAVPTVSGSPVLTFAGIARQATLTPPSTLTERSENASTSSTYKVSADAADTVVTGTSAGPYSTTAGGSAGGIAQTVALRPGSGSGAGGGATGDSEAPLAPTGLTAGSTTTSSVALSWAASSDNVGVTGYRVFRDGAQVGTPATTSYTDTGLTAATTYRYTVAAVDAAGNVSSQSAAVAATTAAETPPPPTGPVSFVAATSVNAASTTISVPSPTGVRAGDVLLATVSVRGAPTITPSAGWTLVRLDTNGTTMRQAVYVRVATGSDASSTWRLSKAYGAVAQVLAYRGVDTTSPVVASAGQVTSGTTLTSPAVTTVSGSPVLTFAGIARQATLTPPSPLTERSENASTSSTYKISADAADTVATATTAGPFTTTAGGSAAGIAQTVSLRPSA